MLGYCYKLEIGTNVDKQKVFELYQKAENNKTILKLNVILLLCIKK
jgi:TPR repeat protein